MRSFFTNCNKKLINELPQRPLTDKDLLIFVRLWKIQNFRGIFSRDTLPRRIRKVESGIINLDDNTGGGTHWVAYRKNGGYIAYFDSFGDLRPPLEVERYLLSDGQGVIHFNYKKYQKVNSVNCGHLSLQFLKGLL